MLLVVRIIFFFFFFLLFVNIFQSKTHFVLDPKLSMCELDYFRNRHTGKVQGTILEIGTQNDAFPTFVGKSGLNLPSYSGHILLVPGGRSCRDSWPSRAPASPVSPVPLTHFCCFRVNCRLSFQIWLCRPIGGRWWAVSVPVVGRWLAQRSKVLIESHHHHPGSQSPPLLG